MEVINDPDIGLEETGHSMTATTLVVQPAVLTPAPQPHTVSPVVWAGIDTHQLIHHAAVVDDRGGVLGDRQFPATAAGYRQLWAWVSSHGHLAGVGIEQTGSYGAGIALFLTAQDVPVWEVNTPDLTVRRGRGKSDQIDAVMAARAVADGRAHTVPKTKTDVVEAIRVLTVARKSAVKTRTKLASQVRDLITTAPQGLREQLLPLSTTARYTACARLRPDPSSGDVVLAATKTALKALGSHALLLTAQIKELDKELDRLVQPVAPTLLAQRQVGIHVAAQLLITAGQNADRLHSEASFARLIGVAPVPANSGKNTTRHRLHRGGDRQANSAVHTVAVGRLKDHTPTIEYMQRRTTEGRSKQDIIRCLKRYIARDLYYALKHDLAALDEL